MSFTDMGWVEPNSNSQIARTKSTEYKPPTRVDSAEKNQFRTVLKSHHSENRDDGFPATPNTAKGTRFINLGDAGVVGLNSHFQAHPDESALFLSRNQIGDLGMARLAELVKSHQSMEHLILSNNQISDASAKSLKLLLAATQRIGWLVLDHNSISDVGANAIAAGLIENQSVKHVVLADNHIGNEGAIGLGRMLAKNSTVQSLFLQGNPIGPEGVKGILDGLKHNTSLKIVDLRDILPLPPQLLRELSEVARQKGIRLKINSEMASGC